VQCFPDTATADAATAVLKWCSNVTTAATGLTAAGDVKRMRWSAAVVAMWPAASAAAVALLADVRGAESPVTSLQRYLAEPAGRPAANVAYRTAGRRAGLYSTRPSWAERAA